MPTPATSKWPAPKSEDEWEDMVLDAMRVLWRDPNAQRNGRRGQRQFGVDIFGCISAVPVGAQAKNTSTVSEAIILDEMSKASQFEPKLTQYHIAFAGDRNTHLQRFVRTLSFERERRGLFFVYIHSFDDIVDSLSSRPEFVRKYWGAFLVAFTASLDALPKILCGPVMSAEAAVELVMALPEMREFARLIEVRSAGAACLAMTVEGKPDLQASRHSLDRAWRLAIGEQTCERFIMTIRIAVDVDSGELLFWAATDNSWVPRTEWLHGFCDHDKGP
jgi:hypothetical protein